MNLLWKMKRKEKKSTNDGELTPHDEKHNKHTNRRTKNQQTS